MSKAALDFNAKYNLNLSSNAFDPIKQKNIANELSGKPKKNIIEIIKRFFTNPYAVVALGVFIVVVLLSIILPHTTQYTADASVVKSKNPGNALTWAKALPPHGQLTTAVLSKTQLDFFNGVKATQNAAHLADSTAPLFDFTDISGNKYQFYGLYIVKYDPWLLLRVLDKDVVNGQTVYATHNSLVGTTATGVDIWTRTWDGTAKSLGLAFLVTIVTTIIGVFLGGIIGTYVGSIIDILFMKIISLYGAIPSIVWYVVIQSMLPASFWSLFVVFVVTGWMSSIGITRMYMWKYVNSDFMKVAETIGVSKLGRIFRHALPNFLGIILFSFVGQIPAVIEGEAQLGFIGLSPNPNGSSLGNMLNEMKSTITQSGEITNVWFLALPTIVILTITMSLYFVALGINDALEPKFRKA